MVSNLEICTCDVFFSGDTSPLTHRIILLVMLQLHHLLHLLQVPPIHLRTTRRTLCRRTCWKMSSPFFELPNETHHLKHGWRQMIRLNLYFKFICWYLNIYLMWMNILASNCPWLIRRATQPLTMVITTWQVKRAEVKPRTHRRFGVFEYVWSVPVDIRLFLVERDRQCVDTAWWLQRWHALLLRCYCVACVLEQKLDLTAGKDL